MPGGGRIRQGSSGSASPGGGGLVEQVVPFTYQSGTMLLQAVVAGSVVGEAWIRIDTPFDDPTASIKLGITASPGQIFAPGDVDVSFAGQYQNPELWEYAGPDFLELIVAPGASTQGSGALLYRYLD
jgi:hypothetical protein